MPDPSAEKFRLYLVRHAHAAWASPGVSDFERPLDEIGRHEARDIAGQAVLSGLRPDAIVSSPARRCMETTAALLDVFRSIRPETDMQLYSSGADAYLQLVLSHAHLNSLMIVGHNPMIEAVAHHLSKPSDVTSPLAMGYPTAGLLVIDLERPLTGDLGKSGEPFMLITPALT
jgi:phosphohistidine phosphatase